VNVDELGGRLISWSRDGNIVFQGSKAKMWFHFQWDHYIIFIQ
jgi:hypothetical protein